MSRCIGAYCTTWAQNTRPRPGRKSSQCHPKKSYDWGDDHQCPGQTSHPTLILKNEPGNGYRDKNSGQTQGKQQSSQLHPKIPRLAHTIPDKTHHSLQIVHQGPIWVLFHVFLRMRILGYLRSKLYPINHKKPAIYG